MCNFKNLCNSLSNSYFHMIFFFSFSSNVIFFLKWYLCIFINTFISFFLILPSKKWMNLTFLFQFFSKKKKKKARNWIWIILPYTIIDWFVSHFNLRETILPLKYCKIKYCSVQMKIWPVVLLFALNLYTFNWLVI